jgi:hypothetical protein
VGHVVHCGVSGACNVDALFFVLGRDRYGFQKIVLRQGTPNFYFASGGICGSRTSFHCIQDAKCQRAIFHASV